jgi:hypothetical protein
MYQCHIKTESENFIVGVFIGISLTILGLMILYHEAIIRWVNGGL